MLYKNKKNLRYLYFIFFLINLLSCKQITAISSEIQENSFLSDSDFAIAEGCVLAITTGICFWNLWKTKYMHFLRQKVIDGNRKKLGSSWFLPFFINKPIRGFFDIVGDLHGRQDYLLHQAIRSKKTNIVQFLIEQGADVNVINNHNETPLELAIKETEDENIIVLLLNAGAKHIAEEDRNLTICDYHDWGDTPLHLAASRGNIGAMHLLLTKKNNMHTKNVYDNIPLDCAIINGKLEAALFLVHQGSRLRGETFEGMYPGHFSNQYHQQYITDEMIKWIRKWGLATAAELTRIQEQRNNQQRIFKSVRQTELTLDTAPVAEELYKEIPQNLCVHTVLDFLHGSEIREPGMYEKIEEEVTRKKRVAPEISLS